jgi:hypothetical protein
MSGKAFKGKVNSTIPCDLVKPNVDRVLSILGLHGVKYKIVGGTNKKYLGDIDIALNDPGVRTAWKMCHLDNDVFWARLQEKLEFLKSKNEIEDFMIVKGWRQFSLCMPLVDEAYYNCAVFDIDGNSDPTKRSFIQIDIHLGNVDWMTKVLGPADKKSEWKALYRTNLIADAVNSITWNKGGFKHRLMMDYKVGVFDVTYKVEPPTGRQTKEQVTVLQKELLITSPDEVARLLFGVSVRWTDINSYENVYKLLTSKKYRYRSKHFRKVLEKFKKRLDKEKLVVPTDVIQWLA